VSRSEQKEQTRQRILEAAGRSFRKGGFGGIGVDGLAKEAGLTSGAFYVHFGSKAEAFRESVQQGMADLG
jgi:AcrR family transcriptional regulator